MYYMIYRALIISAFNIYRIMAGRNKPTGTIYSNNYKYIRRPIIPFLVPNTQNIEIPVRFNYDVLNDVVTNAQKQCYRFSPKPEPYKTVGTQTDYRDSESQTVPWEPPYRIKPGKRYIICNLHLHML